MDGIINLDKPAGITSHDAVAIVRRLAPGVKVGHAGTLDPAATGVLPICLGRATRVAEYIINLPKGYRAAISLGMTTTTGDAEGEVLTSVEPPHFQQADVEKVIDSLKHLQLQVIPPYAAAKHRGRPFYEYARRGKKVPVRMRSIRIYRSELLKFTPESAPQITFEVECSKGTYIRSLAEEIGCRLGCGAHLQALRRIMVGPFKIGAAVSLDDLEKAAAGAGFGELLLPMDQGLMHFISLKVPDSIVKALRDGRAVPWRVLEEAGLPAPPRYPDEHLDPRRIYDSQGNFCALAKIDQRNNEHFLKTEKFLAP